MLKEGASLTGVTIIVKFWPIEVLEGPPESCNATENVALPFSWLATVKNKVPFVANSGGS